MKTITILILTIIISFKSFAQSTIIQPETFQLHLSSNACPSADYTGNIFYHTPTNLFNFCVGINNFRAGAREWIGTSTIYRNSNVGIRNGNPLYELDITGPNRATSFYVGGNMGIGTTTPTEKIEIVDRQLAIRGTADAVTWRHYYFDAADRLDIQENGLSRLQLSNGGNIGIGGFLTVNPPKLYVNGTVNFNGNLREGGFGTMASTETTVQKMVTATMTLNTNLGVPANSCATFTFGLSAATPFTNTPAAFMGNHINVSGTDAHLVMTIESVTTTGGTVRFCNNSGTPANVLSGNSYSIIMIGD